MYFVHFVFMSVLRTRIEEPVLWVDGLRDVGRRWEMEEG
jgi:hypothetical protein